MTPILTQPPSGGCVLKQFQSLGSLDVFRQPPSGGCVLKHLAEWSKKVSKQPAAFGRLCVETTPTLTGILVTTPSRLRAAVC